MGTASTLRTLTFGDLDAEIWGAAWIPGEGPGSAVVGLGSESIVASVELSGSEAPEGWTVAAPGIELSVEPDGDPSSVNLEEGDFAGYDQLCRVTGMIKIGDAQHPVDCPGRRGLRTEQVDRERFESAREVSAWFAPGDGLALLALRPRGSGAHGSDIVSAALFASGSPVAVSDPRLSTTYDADGLPVRVNVELWLGGEEGEEYPRRAAGEGTGAATRTTADGFELVATPFRWHSAGRDGAGVYLLLRSP